MSSDKIKNSCDKLAVFVNWHDYCNLYGKKINCYKH